MKRKYIAIITILAIGTTLLSCKEAAKVVEDLFSQNKQKLMAKQWAVNWDKSYTGTSVVAKAAKTTLKTIGTGSIKFNSNKDLLYYTALTPSGKKVGVWDLTLDYLLTISGNEKESSSILPTDGETLFITLLKNSTIKTVTDTELVLTPIAASVTALGGASTVYFLAK